MRLPPVDTLKSELNSVMSKYDLSVNYFSVAEDGNKIVVGVMFTGDMENKE